MDCIGRAQTLNLTFTIIATLRGRFAGTRVPGRDAGADRTRCSDVNFIILAKKLRSGSGSPVQSEPVSLPFLCIYFLVLFFVRSVCCIFIFFYILNFSSR